MIFYIIDLIKLYRETSISIDETKDNMIIIEHILKHISQYGDIITYEEVVVLYNYLNDRFPYLGYITGELLKMNEHKERVSLTDEEIKIYASLAKFYKINEQRFNI